MLLAAVIFYDLAWWALLFPPVLWFLITAMGSGLIYSNYHIKTYCKSPPIHTKTVALTFDDGPHPETEKVLDLLKAYNKEATFFCIGRQIEQHPDIFKRIIAEGHVIGNHTFSHVRSFGFMNTAKIVKEIKSTDTLIANYTSQSPKFFRPPFGATSPALAKALKITGHKVIGWNIRSLDTVIRDKEKIVSRIKRRLKPGSIVLMHDTSSKSVTVLEQLLVILQQQDYQCTTVDKLLNIPAYEH